MAPSSMILVAGAPKHDCDSRLFLQEFKLLRLDPQLEKCDLSKADSHWRIGKDLVLSQPSSHSLRKFVCEEAHSTELTLCLVGYTTNQGFLLNQQEQLTPDQLVGIISDGAPESAEVVYLAFDKQDYLRRLRQLLVPSSFASCLTLEKEEECLLWCEKYLFPGNSSTSASPLWQPAQSIQFLLELARDIAVRPGQPGLATFDPFLSLLPRSHRLDFSTYPPSLNPPPMSDLARLFLACLARLVVVRLDWTEPEKPEDIHFATLPRLPYLPSVGFVPLGFPSPDQFVQAVHRIWPRVRLIASGGAALGQDTQTTELPDIGTTNSNQDQRTGGDEDNFWLLLKGSSVQSFCWADHHRASRQFSPEDSDYDLLVISEHAQLPPKDAVVRGLLHLIQLSRLHEQLEPPQTQPHAHQTHQQHQTQRQQQTDTETENKPLQPSRLWPGLGANLSPARPVAPRSVEETALAFINMKPRPFLRLQVLASGQVRTTPYGVMWRPADLGGPIEFAQYLAGSLPQQLGFYQTKI